MTKTTSPARNPLFSEPIIDAEQVTTATWEGRGYRVGDRISFRKTTFTTKPGRDGRHERDERVDGTIEELWIEQWRGEILVYAEVLLDDGAPARAWFHRDRVDIPGFTGAALQDALW